MSLTSVPVNVRNHQPESWKEKERELIRLVFEPHPSRDRAGCYSSPNPVIVRTISQREQKFEP